MFRHSHLYKIRLVMFWFVSYIYLITVAQTHAEKWLVVGAAIAFSINHALMFFYAKGWSKLIANWSDIVVAILMGIVFFKSTLYLIFFGVVAITIFLMPFTRNQRRVMVVTMYGVWFGLIVHHWILGDEIDYVKQFTDLLFTTHCFFVGLLLKEFIIAKGELSEKLAQTEEVNSELEAAHEQLGMYVEKIERMTEVKERNRIAREIHDTAGHKLTALIVQLQVAEKMMERDREKTMVAIEHAKTLAKQSLDEIRLSVRTLQIDEESMPFYEKVQVLCSQFSKQAEVDIALNIDIADELIPLSIQPAVIRIIQEGLTNAKRHGGAECIMIDLNLHHNALVGCMKDDGRGTVTIQEGFGLKNMRERIVRQGGAVSFESQQGQGFTMKFTLPIAGRKWGT